MSTLKTTILQMHNMKAGDSVGYSRKTILDKDSVIAAIPIGYADGLNRHLGNRHAYCLVNGQKADYVGNICMDVAMIDVTGIDCKEGDSCGNLRRASASSDAQRYSRHHSLRGADHHQQPSEESLLSEIRIGDKSVRKRTKIR